LGVDDVMADIEKHRRLIRKPWIYYDPTVMEREEIDPLQ